MLAAYPKFPANIDRTHSDLVALRGTKDPNPNGADTSVVEDLYAFAAYLENDVASIPLYRDLDREKLWSIFNTASLRFSQRNDNLGKLCGQLSAAAKTNVFDSDENREAYNLYLVYRSEELTELFATLKGCKKTELETVNGGDAAAADAYLHELHRKYGGKSILSVLAISLSVSSHQ